MGGPRLHVQRDDVRYGIVQEPLRIRSLERIPHPEQQRSASRRGDGPFRKTDERVGSSIRASTDGLHQGSNEAQRIGCESPETSCQKERDDRGASGVTTSTFKQSE